MITYVLQDVGHDGTVLGYYDRLKDAKAECRRYPFGLIIKLQGLYKYEGYHVYKLQWNGSKFSYL